MIIHTKSEKFTQILCVKFKCFTLYSINIIPIHKLYCIIHLYIYTVTKAIKFRLRKEDSDSINNPNNNRMMKCRCVRAINSFVSCYKFINIDYFVYIFKEKSNAL